MTAKSVPCVLANVLVIGGLDPGGGAGVLADARAIHAGGAFACAVVAVQTIQSTRGLVRAMSAPTRRWMEQARVVIAHQRVRSIKTGALGSAANVRAMTKLARAHARIPLVVDPVMLPTRAARGGARLLDASALDATRDLVTCATLVTANAREAEELTDERVETIEDAHHAAKMLVAMGARAALIKGGHLKDASSRTRAVDVLATRERVIEIAAPRISLSREVHGTGCALASLAAAHLARGASIERAVRAAKRAHHAALKKVVDVGGGDTLVF
jgi:hydroxymethylpyrimidine/phosphomethylpyrimidine kinase